MSVFQTYSRWGRGQREGGARRGRRGVRAAAAAVAVAAIVVTVAGPASARAHLPSAPRHLRVQVGADEPGNLVPCYLHYYVSWDRPARGAAQVTSYSLTPEIEGQPLTTTSTNFTYYHYDSAGLGEGAVVTVTANSAAGSGPAASTVVHLPADPCNAVAPTSP